MAIRRHSEPDQLTDLLAIKPSEVLGFTSNKRRYPCDDGDCPFGAAESNRGYFCRDNCGLGVYEEEPTW